MAAAATGTTSLRGTSAPPVTPVPQSRHVPSQHQHHWGCQRYVQVLTLPANGAPVGGVRKRGQGGQCARREGRVLGSLVDGAGDGLTAPAVVPVPQEQRLDSVMRRASAHPKGHVTPAVSVAWQPHSNSYVSLERSTRYRVKSRIAGMQASGLNVLAAPLSPRYRSTALWRRRSWPASA